ncbi:protein-histidine kinase [Gigaspora margarita]|uniref:histidine kinase n=1 Tax=Gigaspora margarita TaxID=4874 RepID=A0A8H3X778_GIGMA|nr:protein-histidine kinase [Gigaspora margarita]
MNGYELLNALRSNAKTREIPVILLSAKAGEDSIIEGLDRGADDYLIKPFSSRQLITRIRANIELSLLRCKISFQQSKEEETKQLLFSISNKVPLGLDINNSLLDIIKEINSILPSERIFIIANAQSEFMKNKIVALYEDSESITPTTYLSTEIIDKSKSHTSTNSQFLNNDSGINVCLNVYSDNVCKNVSELSAEIRLNKNAENEIKMKAVEAANKTKSQILANTSHELRTPLGAIVGILSSFEKTILTDDQRDMVDIMISVSNIVLSIVNNILDVAKLEARKITLRNRTLDLLELFEDTIEEYGKKAGTKKVELIVNCEIDTLPRSVKGDPDRLNQVLSRLLSNAIKFTNKGKIVLTISMQLQEDIDEDKDKPTYGQSVKKEDC